MCYSLKFVCQIQLMNEFSLDHIIESRGVLTLDPKEYIGCLFTFLAQYQVI
jgi:hypothetical protein